METYKCEKCSQEISEKVAKFSKEVHGKYLCMGCQQKGVKLVPKTLEKESKTGTIKIHGKDFVPYAELLKEAHKQGLMKIETEILNIENTDFKVGPVIVKATTLFTQESGKADDKGNKIYWHKTFEGIGDASKENVDAGISKHIIRQAETRAKARALRDAVGEGRAAKEELGGDDGKK